MSRHLLRLGGGLLSAALMALLLATPEAAAKPRIGVAVEALANNGTEASVLRALSQSMQTTVDENPRLHVVPRNEADLVLYASITGLSDQPMHDEREVDCRVSVIVTDASGGAIRMTLSGRAIARGMSRSNGLTITAMTAAVRRALSPLEQGLRASH